MLLPAVRNTATASLRHFASSSRLTLLHPIPLSHPPSHTLLSCPIRSFHSSKRGLEALSGITPTSPRRASIAQQLPAETAAYEDVPAPAYISPASADKGEKAKEPRKRIRAQKAAIKMVCHLNTSFFIHLHMVNTHYPIVLLVTAYTVTCAETRLHPL